MNWIQAYKFRNIVSTLHKHNMLNGCLVKDPLVDLAMKGSACIMYVNICSDPEILFLVVSFWLTFCILLETAIEKAPLQIVL